MADMSEVTTANKTTLEVEMTQGQEEKPITTNAVIEPSQVFSNKRKHDGESNFVDGERNSLNSDPQVEKTDINSDLTTSKKLATEALIQVTSVELDEANATELRTKATRNLVANLATNKLDQLKRLHSECIQMIGEELFLEKKLAYIDYTNWVAPQPLLNRDRLDHLSLKVSTFSFYLLFDIFEKNKK